jgi:hypothetical protein
MTVPNEHIGSIIGKGGSKIAEIRQMSGANIQISKGTDKEQANSAERTVNISGSAEAVTLAKNLINMSLELHQLGGEKSGEGGYEQHQQHHGNGDHSGHDYRDYGYGNMQQGGGGGTPGLGAAANREVMQALATLSHFNSMSGGNLFGADSGYAAMGNMGRGGRSNGSARGNDRSGSAPRSKFSPY